MPFKTICSWTLSIPDTDSDLNVKLNSTGTAYIQINYNHKSTPQQTSDHYTLSQHSKLSLKLPVSHLELLAYSYSRESPIRLQLAWTNKNTKSQVSSNPSPTVVISVSCISVLIFIVLFVLCICIQQRRKAARVFNERTYQYIQRDLSNNSFIDSVVPSKYAQNELPDPCCICFDK